VGTTGLTREEALARGIAAMGRVARDEDGFTVYGAGPAPDAYRVFEDPHAGTRCTCARFAGAFAAGAEYECEHILAVAYWCDPPADEAAAAAEPAADTNEPIRRVV
jgi:hypothetical protein